jgi:hypothetical protein
MLTYLYRAPSQHRSQRSERFVAVAVARTCRLAVQPAPRLFPGEVVYHSQVGSPENGGAVWHGQHTCVDEDYQRSRPCIAGPHGRLRPAAGQFPAEWRLRTKTRSHQSFLSTFSWLRSYTGSPVAVSLSRFCIVLVLEAAGVRSDALALSNQKV